MGKVRRIEWIGKVTATSVNEVQRFKMINKTAVSYSEEELRIMDRQWLKAFLMEAQEESLKRTRDCESRSKSMEPVNDDCAGKIWATRWVASPVAYVFPSERREEWLGDLYEINQRMLSENYPTWIINVVNLCRTAVLIISAMQINIQEFILSGFKRVH